ncbi:hypothetical protein [Lactococcus lactis]|uniref:hypothetical protein n=1 Tax=Lactococcus lactis TaxID=1358 RepID=UPI0021A2691C|nr:hypothetical protein [Lactococcus lactis]MCT0052070.1 hypothetical protein [Lactococcus lactis subsp. lactis]
MKSSWKKQRQATKKRQIKLLRWRNNFVRKYGFKNVAELGIRVSEAVRKTVESCYNALKQLTKMRTTNETFV